MADRPFIISEVYRGPNYSELAGYGVFVRRRRIDSYPGLGACPSYHDTKQGAENWAKQNRSLLAHVYARGN